MEHLLEKSGSVSRERILTNSTLLWAVLLPPLPPHQCHYHVRHTHIPFLQHHAHLWRHDVSTQLEGGGRRETKMFFSWNFTP